MHNFNSLFSAIKDLATYIKKADRKQKESPVLGFIVGGVEYFTHTAYFKESQLALAYRPLLIELRELINKIPEGKEGVETIAQSHTDNDTVVVKSFSADGFPYCLIVRPFAIQGQSITYAVQIIIACANIQRAKDINLIKE